MIRRRRAFSLIEVSVVLVMVGIIGAAAASICSLVLTTMKNSRTLAALGVRSQLPMLYLQTELQRAGGNGIPPAAAVIVENECLKRGELPKCDGTDRVSVFTAIQGPVCKATRVMTGEPNIFTFTWAQGGCCLNKEITVVDQATGATTTQPFVGHVMLQTMPTAPVPMWRPIYLERVEADTCEFVIEDLLPHAMLPAGALTMTDNQTVDAVLIEARTFYLDPDTHSLYLHLDSTKPNGPGEPEVEGRRLLVADRIYDFQMALGIDDDKNGFYQTSEWAYRGGNEAPATLGKVGPGLIWFTMVTGIEANTGNGSAPVRSPLRGPTAGIGGPGTSLAGMYLRSTSLQVAPLNGALDAGFSFSGTP